MPNYPPWNKNAGENVVCRVCEHFQRYDNTPGTDNCQGECRKEPLEWMADVNNVTQAAAGEVVAAFAFVPFGNTTWCSGFQRSLEQNIPTMVAGKSNCADQDWTDWFTPHDNMYGGAPRPNKKTTLDSCWYCEHFQREQETPTSGNPCYGFCVIDPPRNFAWNNFNTGPGVNQIDFAYQNPRIKNSAYMWCSKWERSRQVVPDPPQDQGVNCAEGG